MTSAPGKYPLYKQNKMTPNITNFISHELHKLCVNLYYKIKLTHVVPSLPPNASSSHNINGIMMFLVLSVIDFIILF